MDPQETSIPQTDEVLRQRYEIVMNTLGKDLSVDDRREIMAKIASDYVNAPAYGQGLATALSTMPFRARLRWHGEGALVNVGTFVLVGLGAAFIGQRINKRRAERGEAAIGTDTNPFESTENVEASGRSGKNRKASGESHLHATH